MGEKKRLIVALTGSSGVIYGIRLLEVLRGLREFETHLIISNSAKRIIEYETTYTVKDVESLCSVVHDVDDLFSPLSSGSFITSGMIVAPCSIKTLSSIANSFSSNLITRAADVCLKEGRRLVLLVRETPFHLGHLRLMLKVAEAGAVVMPPIPAFYTCPSSIDDIINHTVGKVLDQFGIHTEIYRRWKGKKG